MKILKRLLLTGMILSATILAGAYTYLRLYAGPRIKLYLEQDLATQMKMQIQIESFAIDFFPPVAMVLRNVSLKKGSLLSAQIEKIEFHLRILEAVKAYPKLFPAVDLTIYRPVVQVQKTVLAGPPTKQTPATIPKALPTGIALPKGFDAAASIKVIDGQINYLQLTADGNSGQNNDVQHPPAQPQEAQHEEAKQVQLDGFQFSLDFPSLFKDWNLKAAMKIHSKMLPVKELPFTFQAQSNVNLESLGIDVPAGSFSLGSIDIQFKGKSDLNKRHHQWTIAIELPELGQLPQLPIPGKWSGKLKGQALVKFSDQLSVSADLEATQVRGEVEETMGDLYAKGLVVMDTKAHLDYENEILKPQASGQVDLTQLLIRKGNLMQKAAGIPLKSEFSMRLENSLVKVEQLSFQLASIIASASGELATQPEQKSNLSLKIQKANLQGLEQIFLPLQKMPVAGQLEINAQVSGNLSKPQNLAIQIKPLQLSGFKANLEWQSADKTLRVAGPINADLKAVLNFQGAEVQGSQVDLSADLTGLAIEMKDRIRKASQQLLRLEVKAKQKGTQLEITTGQLLSWIGILNFTGQISNPLQPQVNVAVELKQFDIQKISAQIPMMQSLGLLGFINAKSRIVGTYDFKKGIQQSSLTSDSEISVDLKSYSYQSPPTTTPPAAPAPVVQQPLIPLVPDWPIIKNSNLKAQVLIETFFFNGIPLSKLVANTLIRKGQLDANFSIAKAFSGSTSVAIKNTPLLANELNVEGWAKWNDLQAGNALDSLLPAWKGLIRGTTQGQIAFKAVDFRRNDFVNKLKAEGQVEVKNGWIVTLPLQQMINEKLAAIKGLGDKYKLQTENLSGQISTKFRFSGDTVFLDPFQIRSFDKNELKTKGWVKTNKTLDLLGEFYLAQVNPNDLLIKANLDSEKRFKIPIHITGSVLKPDIGIGESLMGLLNNAVNAQIEEAKRQAAIELEKKLEGLNKEAAQKLELEKRNLQLKAEAEKRKAEASAKNKLEAEIKKNIPDFFK